MGVEFSELAVSQTTRLARRLTAAGSTWRSTVKLVRWACPPSFISITMAFPYRNTRSLSIKIVPRLARTFSCGMRNSHAFVTPLSTARLRALFVSALASRRHPCCSRCTSSAPRLRGRLLRVMMITFHRGRNSRSQHQIVKLGKRHFAARAIAHSDEIHRRQL